MNRIPTKRDPEFRDRLFAEIDDFILICVEALERMYQDGTIKESSGSRAAVQQLRQESDTVEAFLADRTVKAIGERIKRGALYSRYMNYCEDMERTPHKKQAFFKSVRLKGYAEIKSDNAIYFTGISFCENIPENSHKNSLSIPQDTFASVPEEGLPFD